MRASRILIPAGITAVLVLAACGQHHKSASATDHFKRGASEMTQGAKQVATRVEATASDVAVTTRVKANLAANQGLASFSIHVTTTNGIVTLSGKVDSDAARKLAGQVAGKTEGVRVVVNEIAIKSG